MRFRTKLKVSRLLTCFSMVANLAAADSASLGGRRTETVRRDPRDRLRRLASLGGDASDLVAALDQRYEAFLRTVQRPKAKILAEFEDGDRRRCALIEAGEFGDLMYELIKSTTDARRMRYLLI